MQHGKIKKVHRPVRREDLVLSEKEIETFVHNAQLALLENVDDDKIPGLYFYKCQLVQQFQTSSVYSPNDLACLLVSVAWDLINPSKTVQNDPTIFEEDGEDIENPVVGY
jgi:hypothetical protein